MKGASSSLGNAEDDTATDGTNDPNNSPRCPDPNGRQTPADDSASHVPTRASGDPGLDVGESYVVPLSDRETGTTGGGREATDESVMGWMSAMSSTIGSSAGRTTISSAGRTIDSSLSTPTVDREFEALMRQSLRSTPGAYHVMAPSELQRTSTPGSSAAPPRTQLRRSSNDPDGAGADIEDAVAVPVNPPTIEALPVVDALDASIVDPPSRSGRSSLDGTGADEEHGSIAGNSGPSTRPDADSDESDAKIAATSRFKGKERGKWLGATIFLVLLIVILAVALGVGLSVSGSASPASANIVGEGYRLVQVERASAVTASPAYASSSVALSGPYFQGEQTPGAVIEGFGSEDRGEASNNLILALPSGVVEYHRWGVRPAGPGKVPAPERIFLNSNDTKLADEADPADMPINIEIGHVTGETFAVAYSNRVRIYSSTLHERIMKINPYLLLDVNGELDKGNPLPSGEDIGLSRPHPSEPPPNTVLSNEPAFGNMTWTLYGDFTAGDVAKGFGSTLGYSSIGHRFLWRLVVGSDSGQVRVYRSNSNKNIWERIDGGLLDSEDPNEVVAVAISGTGNRFAVGYPAQGRVALFQFIDEEGDSVSDPKFRILDEVYGARSDDSFGRSVSLDANGHLLAVGAEGYAMAFSLRSIGPIGETLVRAGNSIPGDEMDGQGFGRIVSVGALPIHQGGCLACPFQMDGQRMAVSSPDYDNRRGRVLLFEYKLESDSWEPIASSIVGSEEGEGFGYDMSISKGSFAVVASSKRFIGGGELEELAGGREVDTSSSGAVRLFQVKLAA